MYGTDCLLIDVANWNKLLAVCSSKKHVRKAIAVASKISLFLIYSKYKRTIPIGYAIPFLDIFSFSAVTYYICLLVLSVFFVRSFLLSWKYLFSTRISWLVFSLINWTHIHYKIPQHFQYVLYTLERSGQVMQV
jgi:hypothetical protein